ncbi:MAG: AAA family ATPase, partial [Bacteroidales bacterium]|nr:AAA family ATPase [Bacteroidales bacterium]
MIKSLYIRNYVLIDESELTFDKGLTCITGEAGAGKSIILGAIGLVLGDRADTKLCFDKDEKSIIEAAFEFDDDKLKSFFEENNIDYETNSTVRREITPQGKSRCFINDTPVNLQVLRTFGMKILDLHTQYQKFSLSDNNSQLEYLDNYIKDVVSVEDYQSCYNAYMAVSHELDASKALMDKQTKEKDYVNFLYKELEDAKLVAGELELLEKELDRLNNAELIKD